MGEKLFRVGDYIDEFNALTGQELPCGEIMQSAGLAVHVQKHHPDETGNVALVPSIIAEPDYVGHNPKEPGSVYEISSGKLTNRLNSGRLKKFKEK